MTQYVFLMARMNQRTIAVVMAVAGLALCVPHTCLANAKAAIGPAKDARVAEIMAVWRKRQDAIRTVRATLELHTVLKPRTFPLPRGVRRPTEAKQEYSRLMTVFLDFANKRYRVDTTGGSYAIRTDEVFPEHKISTFVDGKAKSYTNMPKGIMPKGILKYQGAIGGERAFKYDLGETFMQTLLLYVRPCGGLPGLTSCWPELGPLRPVSKGKVGLPDNIMEFECTCYGVSTPLLLDANRDYAVVRIGRTSRQVTIDYGPDDGYGPVPTRSTFVLLNRHGQIMRVTTTRVKEIEINPALTDSMFEFDFPNGTRVAVIDTVPRHWLVANAQGQLVPPQRIEERTQSGPTWIRLSAIAATIVILIVLAGLLVRRRPQWF